LSAANLRSGASRKRRPVGHSLHFGFEAILRFVARCDQQFGPVIAADVASDVVAEEVEAVVDVRHVRLLDRQFELQFFLEEDLELLPQAVRFRLAAVREQQPVVGVSDERAVPLVLSPGGDP